ncbi:MAG: haloacid dehalogenase type II [Alphaproteobacteria bacterium]|nr:haloacid dehalogenase type II [Alphaproteobacteria bacterium]
MSNKALCGIRACVFDAYGTLFDVASAARCSTADVVETETAGRLAKLWRNKQLQYTWLRAVQNRHADLWQVTGEALDFALETLAMADPALRERLMQGYLALDAYPEAAAALRALREAGIATAILSNGTPAMLSAVVDHAGLGELFDHVLSVEEAGVYKPHAQVYQLACDRLGIPAEAILFVSSNGWDAWAASAFGMRVAWCSRQGLTRERLPGAPDHDIRSLAELPGLLAAPAAI